MKRFILTIILSTICAIGFSKNINKYYGYEVCYGVRDYSTGQILWKNWQPTEYIDIEITDYKSYSTVEVNTINPQFYTTYSDGIGNIFSEDGVYWQAIDEENIPCRIKMVYYMGEIHLYFFWNNIAWGYKILRQ